MDTNGVIDRIIDLVRPVVEIEDIELVEVELTGRGRKTLRIFIDKPGGVTVGDCAQVSRRVNDVLDMEDPIEGGYVLEVSSPGLDRELKTKSDFQRFRGRMVKVITNGPIKGANVHVGTLMGSDDESLWVDLDGKVVVIPARMIAKVRLEPGI